MRVSEAFPSKWLAAADLQGRTVPVVISHIKVEEVGQNPTEHKPVVYFQNKEKGLVLNITNANNLAVAYGDEMGDWHGKPVELFVTQTEYKGKPVQGLRVRAPQQPGPQPISAALPPVLPPVQPPAPASEILSDEIPF